MSFDLFADIEDLKRLHPLLQAVPKGLDIAVSRALNKTIEGARTDAKAMIRRDYNIKAGAIQKELRIRRATANSLQASLRGSGSPGIPMINFGVTPRRVPSTVRSKGRYTPAVGISAMVRKGERITFPGFFVARMTSGHVGVFKRTFDSGQGKYSPAFKAKALTLAKEKGSKTKAARQLGISRSTLAGFAKQAGRSPRAAAPEARRIKERFGPSAIKLLAGDRYDEELEEKINDRLEGNLQREARQVLRQAGLLK